MNCDCQCPRANPAAEGGLGPRRYGLRDMLNLSQLRHNAHILFWDISQSASREWTVIGLDVDADIYAARMDVDCCPTRSLAMVQNIGLWLFYQSRCLLSDVFL